MRQAAGIVSCASRSSKRAVEEARGAIVPRCLSHPLLAARGGRSRRLQLRPEKVETLRGRSFDRGFARMGDEGNLSFSGTRGAAWREARSTLAERPGPWAGAPKEGTEEGKE